MIKDLPLFLIIFPFLPLQAEELPAKDFFFCLHRKARTVEARTVRVHQFFKEKKCAVIYSVEGQDKVLSSGRWLAFCEKKAREVVNNLQKGLWKCTEQQKDKIQVFYPSVSS